jgi:hypothetical protein
MFALSGWLATSPVMLTEIGTESPSCNGFVITGMTSKYDVVTVKGLVALLRVATSTTVTLWEPAGASGTMNVALTLFALAVPLATRLWSKYTV